MTEPVATLVGVDELVTNVESPTWSLVAEGEVGDIVEVTPTKPETILVRSTLHFAGGVYPGWVGRVPADSPWVQENLGKNLIPVADPPAGGDDS